MRVWASPASSGTVATPRLAVTGWLISERPRLATATLTFSATTTAWSRPVSGSSSCRAARARADRPPRWTSLNHRLRPGRRLGLSLHRGDEREERHGGGSGSHSRGRPGCPGRDVHQRRRRRAAGAPPRTAKAEELGVPLDPE